MADENLNSPEGGGGAPASLSLEAAVKLIEQLAPAIKAITEFIAAVKGSAGEPAAPAAISDEPADPDDDDTAAAGDTDPAKPACDTDPAPADTGGEKEPDKKPEGAAAGMDAAEIKRSVMAEIAARDRLYRQVSEHVGAFDHADMTADDVARYGIRKLGIKADAGQEMAVLSGFLQGRPAPRKQPAATVAPGAAANDAAPGGDNFITRHLKGA